MTEPLGLGWRKSPYDARDLSPKVLKQMVDAGTAEPVAWEVPNILYQNGFPRCVGYSIATLCSAGAADANPDPTVGNDLGDRIYFRAKELTNDTDYNEGTYLRAGAQAAKEFGLISAYAFGTWAEAEDWLNTKGPVVVGIPWYDSMDHPDSEGLIRAFGGPLRGGHAICVAKNNQPTPADNGLPNTWSVRWGKDGWCYMTDEDLQPLVDHQGEVMMAVKFVKVPWPDWGDQDRLAAVYVHATGAMQGKEDGKFHPYEHMTFRQVYLVAQRVGLQAPKEWLTSALAYQTCDRIHVRDTFPGFTWTQERWDEPVTRRHFALLLYRYLKEKHE